MKVHLKAKLTDCVGNQAHFEMYPIALDQIVLAIRHWQNMGFVRCELDVALELYKRERENVCGN